MFSVPLSLGSRPVAVSNPPALWSPDFPPAADPAGDCPNHSGAIIAPGARRGRGGMKKPAASGGLL